MPSDLFSRLRKQVDHAKDQGNKIDGFSRDRYGRSSFSESKKDSKRKSGRHRSPTSPPMYGGTAAYGGGGGSGGDAGERVYPPTCPRHPPPNMNTNTSDSGRGGYHGRHVSTSASSAIIGGSRTFGSTHRSNITTSSFGINGTGSSSNRDRSVSRSTHSSYNHHHHDPHHHGHHHGHNGGHHYLHRSHHTEAPSTNPRNHPFDLGTRVDTEQRAWVRPRADPPAAPSQDQTREPRRGTNATAPNAESSRGVAHGSGNGSGSASARTRPSTGPPPPRTQAMQGRHGPREARANAAEARRRQEQEERERDGNISRGRAGPRENDGFRGRGTDKLPRGDDDNASRRSQSLPREFFDVSPGPSGGEDSE